MCTLSWWIHPEQRGVLFNRDELRTRKHGLSPVIFEAAPGLKVLAPVDPEGGGTWLGVNEAGLIVGLLNYYPFHQGDIPERTSRGSLVRELLQGHSQAKTVLETLNRDELRRYRGFLLFLMDRNNAPLGASWDGESWSRLSLGESEGILSTSSFEGENCLRRRSSLFEGAARDPASLRRIHSYHDPAEPAYSPLMSRPDAATDSLTEITLDRRMAKVRFQAVRGVPPRLGEAHEEYLALLNGPEPE